MGGRVPEIECSVDSVFLRSCYNGRMYLRRCCRKRSGKEHIYWELVENVRTERGPRQRVVAYLGGLSKPTCEGIAIAAEGRCYQGWMQLFEEDLEPEWVKIDTRNVRVERTRDFGGSWLALHLMGVLGFNQLFWKLFASTRAQVNWSAMAMVLIACRLCRPSSELQIADCLYERTALEDLLGLPSALVNDDRLYRSLDKLVAQKEAIETHLKGRLGELFGLSYDLLLYDMTSTYIEGVGAANEQMQRGYSRDGRSDCKQVCIALVVTEWGMPLGYEVFDGNRSDVSDCRADRYADGEALRSCRADLGDGSRDGFAQERGVSAAGWPALHFGRPASQPEIVRGTVALRRLGRD